MESPKSQSVAAPEDGTLMGWKSPSGVFMPAAHCIRLGTPMGIPRRKEKKLSCLMLSTRVEYESSAVEVSLKAAMLAFSVSKSPCSTFSKLRWGPSQRNRSSATDGRIR